MPYEYILTTTGALTTASGSPKILVHTRGGKVVGIYCDQPAKILEIETQDNRRYVTSPRSQAFVAAVCPQTTLKVVGGYGTSMHHMLAMAFDDPSMDEDLRHALEAHGIELEQEWADVV
jgi:hypothetical protein